MSETKSNIQDILEVFTGKEFFETEFPKRQFLVDKILRERDAMLIVGGEKAGKSILTQQIVFSLTSGSQPFLDEYEVLKQCKVVLVMGEGDKTDAQIRYKSMREHLEFDEKNFLLIYAKNNLNLQLKENMQIIIGQITNKWGDEYPDVVIFDPLYFCFSGSISKDDIVRDFLGNVREMKEMFGCAVIIVHHTHKLKFDQKGHVVEEGDEAVFGSGTLKWWPDHLVLFSYNKNTGIRTFSCNTQRSGDIVRYIDLRLNTSPLYLTKAEHQISLDKQTIHCKADLILKVIEENEIGLSAEQIYKGIGIAKSTFYRDIKKLLTLKQVEKLEGVRPIIYKKISVSVS